MGVGRLPIPKDAAVCEVLNVKRINVFVKQTIERCSDAAEAITIASGGGGGHRITPLKFLNLIKK